MISLRQTLVGIIILLLSQSETLLAQHSPKQIREDILQIEYRHSPYLQTDYISQISADSGNAARPTTKESSGVEYAIQVGAFAIHRNAERMQRRFRSYGYRTDIYENFLDGKNLLYLVWVGSFKTMEEARQNLVTIEGKSGIKGILRTRTRWRRW